MLVDLLRGPIISGLFGGNAVDQYHRGRTEAAEEAKMRTAWPKLTVTVWDTRWDVHTFKYNMNDLGD